MRTWIPWAVAPIALPLLSGRPPSAAQDLPRPDGGSVHALFIEHCAACHGERGDGRGTTDLPRPARSFLDGGFSYGNTRTAILRTITHGIPGTPMPSFREALDGEQREAMVEYVIGLGPPREEVTPAETVMVVKDRPLVVRGYLPPLQEGAPSFPRGLLLGLPTGTTFQYRADDVRLLAVRQGEFVERRDWVGRGGNTLQPLGTPTFTCDAGRASFALAGGGGLVARLTGTWVEGQGVGLVYELQRPTGEPIARVREEPSVVSTEHGPGFARRFAMESLGASAVLEGHVVYAQLGQYEHGFVIDEHTESDDGWQDDRREATAAWLDRDGRYQVGIYEGSIHVSLEKDHLRIELLPGRPVAFSFTLVSSVDAESVSGIDWFEDR